MLTIAAVLILQAAVMLFFVMRYPQTTVAILRAAAALLEAAAGGRGRRTASASVPAARTRRVLVRSHCLEHKAKKESKKSARELEAPSEKLENDLIRTMVRLGSNESAARLHVLGLRERGLIHPDMAIETAVSVTFQNLKPAKI